MGPKLENSTETIVAIGSFIKIGIRFRQEHIKEKILFAEA